MAHGYPVLNCGVTKTPAVASIINNSRILDVHVIISLGFVYNKTVASPNTRVWGLKLGSL